MTDPAVPGWYPDPFVRHAKRLDDGTVWTDRVSSHGREAVEPPTGDGRVPTVGRSAEKIQADVARAGGVGGGAGGGTIFTESVLVVNQKATLIEVNHEYAIFDRRRDRLRGGPHLQDLGGPGQDAVHDSRQLRRPHPPTVRRARCGPWWWRRPRAWTSP